jgi:hypothetical protein
MNNTKTLAMFAIFIAATLVLGTFATTTTITTKTAFAASNNKSGNTVTAQINKQKASQSGFDGTQEQEAQNTICTHPGDNASCVSESEGAVSTATQAPQAPRTCEECFAKFLTQPQISFVLNTFDATLADLCTKLKNSEITEADFSEILREAGVIGTTATELIQCLKQAGAVFQIE